MGSRLDEKRFAKINALLNKVKEGVRETGRNYDTIPKMTEAFFSFHENCEKALQSAKEWKATTIPNILSRILTIHGSWTD